MPKASWLSPPKLAVFLIALLGLVVLVLLLFFSPATGTAAWATFHLALVISSVVLGLSIWVYFFPQPKVCDLYFYVQKETNDDGHWHRVEVSCLEPSVGKVRIISAWGWKYFCRTHDPRASWMRKWLRERNIKTAYDTLRKLRFVDWSLD